MVRLQRVTFLALHNYLGLTTELFNTVLFTWNSGILHLYTFNLQWNKKALKELESYSTKIFQNGLDNNIDNVYKL